MVRKKIVFLGSKPIGYRCLEHLLQVKDELNIEVAGILTQARKEFEGDHDLPALAGQHGIPVLDNVNSLPVCDIVYSVQYHQILKTEHIGKARQIAVNLHMAPLPEYRGSNQFSYAIIDEKTEFGTTIHQIDERIDHGDILFQKRFPIPENCWVNDLYQLTFDASVRLFKQTLQHIVEGKYTTISQQSLVHKYGSSLHFRNEIADLKQINLDWDKEKIERHIRATYMPGFEPPFTLIDGKKIYFSTRPS
jgi:methionyl-tRNA formyltransferase